MKVPSIKLPPERDSIPIHQERAEYSFTSTRVQSRKMVLLSLRRPYKPSKFDVKELLNQQVRPIFAQPLPAPLLPVKKNDFKVRSIASKSVHEVISKSIPEVSSVWESTELIDNDKLLSAPYKAVRMRQDFARITRSFGIVANLRQSMQAIAKQARPKKSKKTFYVNNFMRTRYSRTKESRPSKAPGLGEKQERYQIFPWEKEKPLETEEDNFLNS